MVKIQTHVLVERSDLEDIGWKDMVNMPDLQDEQAAQTWLDEHGANQELVKRVMEFRIVPV